MLNPDVQPPSYIQGLCMTGVPSCMGGPTAQTHGSHGRILLQTAMHSDSGGGT